MLMFMLMFMLMLMLMSKCEPALTSLAHQIDAGLKQGYKEDVVEAIIRAINPGLMSYLKGRPNLELARLRRI